MSSLKYTSARTGADVELDVAAATLDQLVDAYESLSARATFPVKTAKRYADQLRALAEARPDLMEHLKADAHAARTARLGCSCAPRCR